MKRIHILTGLTLALAISAHGQVSNPSIITVSSDPTGVPCTQGLPNLQVLTTGIQYSCQNVVAGVGKLAALSGGASYAGCTSNGANGISCQGGLTSGAGSGASGHLDLNGSTSGSAHVSVAAAAGTPASLLWPTTDPLETQTLAAHAPAPCTGYPTATCVQLYWGGTVAQLSDTFGGTVGTLLSSHAANTGQTWAQDFTTESPATTTLTGTNSIVSATGSSTSAYTSSLVPNSADYTVQATCTISGTSKCGLYGRATSGASGDGYAVFMIGGTGVQLYKATAGSYTLLGSTYATGATGTHVLALSMSGTTISATYDGVTVVSVTDSTKTAAGKVGVYLLNLSANNATMSSLSVN